MKTFYSILLVLIFIMHGNARPETYVFRPHFIQDTTDTNITLLPDSVLAVAEEKKVTKKVAPLLKGTASFYSKSLEGSETATGEVFSHANYTAASNNLPLNAWVKVTNLRNGKTVVVRINDRMHPKMAKKGRVIDLTIAAAKKIGLTTKIGLTKVSLEVMDKSDVDETNAPIIATLSK
ncbi:septal ring lytic transglycosylase RlpA family protein [Panacibacter sp. DH6]|uniref:Probable endolytic peptidoglycan transglycosylase RlpA n=1 Tax=Panacibacter microcysteis TaxID=2793269 RepID=A0A931E2W9_9BACT|nr:septal ring lytic transglycosylase RlpA family protein [Panacibacter microcysteis]MBG9376605.1 septal ring lytic transglycosylase RlpA family protein [Panacibacter microcysteis]